jgi:hypothetical protein
MALQWRILVHKLSRWNWRGMFEDRLGERVWVPGSIGNLLYPSTIIEVGGDYEPHC